jgi:thioredoxin reductase (NADPH)
VVQARRFGAELLLARPLVDVSADGPGYVAELSDGTLVRGRAVLFASGVEWRRLDVPGIDDLLGAGVYYGAGPGRARRWRPPRTDGAAGIGLVTNTARYLMTGSDVARKPGSNWPLPRELLTLETNGPGVFAAGDVRCGSVKRCAAAIGEGSMAVALVHRRLAEVGGG